DLLALPTSVSFWEFFATAQPCARARVFHHASPRSQIAKGADMPIYQNSTPPFALSSGDVGFSFNNEAFPAANTAGSQFALPSFTGMPDGGTSVCWQTVFGSAPARTRPPIPATSSRSPSPHENCSKYSIGLQPACPVVVGPYQVPQSCKFGLTRQVFLREHDDRDAIFEEEYKFARFVDLCEVVPIEGAGSSGNLRDDPRLTKGNAEYFVLA